MTQLTRVDLYTRYPFGFFLKKRRPRLTGDVIVFPRLLGDDIPRDRFRPTQGELQSSNRIGGGTDIHSFRDYVRGSELKAAGLDWRSSLVARWRRDPKLAACAEIVGRYLAGDASLATAEQRARRFADWGHGCRSTYMAAQATIMKMRGWRRLPKPEHGGDGGFARSAATVVADSAAGAPAANDVEPTALTAGA